LIVHSFSQMRKAAREKSQEVVVVGALASAIKRAFECPEEIEKEDDLHELIHAYDVVDYRNLNQYEGLILCRKLRK
jgi:hypothetical protein